MNIVQLLIKNKLTISAAESFTGGGFSNYITNISHASKTFMGSIVSYDASIKENILGVKKETIDKYGTVSKECALEMVRNTKSKFKTDIAVSFTGNAGPTASEGKEVGLVYIGYINKDKEEVKELHLKGTRKQIKKQAIEYAINRITQDLPTKGYKG